MPDAITARESHEARAAVLYVNPDDPTGPMLDRLPKSSTQPKPKPKRTNNRAPKKKS